MEEKPWRANMKKAATKIDGDQDGEKEAGRPGSEEDGEEEEEDELAKRPWRNNMNLRETRRKSGEGKRGGRMTNLHPTDCTEQRLEK